MAWTLFYLVSTLVSAFQGEPVPWSNFCDNEWAHKDSCIRPVVLNEYSDRNYVPLVSFENLESVNSQKILPASASQQYFDRYVLMRFDQQGEISHGLGNMGKINLPLLGCLAVTWLVVFLSVVKVCMHIDKLYVAGNGINSLKTCSIKRGEPLKRIPFILSGIMRCVRHSLLSKAARSRQWSIEKANRYSRCTASSAEKGY